jgi:uncharacterized protein
VIALPDVNVLVAIAWPSHVHHAEALAWFEATADAGWATSPVTETGFVRMCMNPAVVGRGTSAEVAIEMLHELRRVGAHTFWTDATSAADLAPIGRRLQGYRQVTDAHLVHMAESNGGTLATFDKAAPAIADDERAVTVIAGKG